MSISIHNYEIYFIDYHEGQLSEDQTAALMDFLAAHPELKEEFDAFDNTPVAPDLSITFNNKAKLKKDSQYYSEDEQKIIAFMEGDLAADEKATMEDQLNKDTVAAALLDQYGSTRSLPDMAIKYPDKAGLKKSVPIFGARLAYALAASILILLGISSLFVFDLSGDAVTEKIRIAKLTARENKLLETASMPLVLNKRDVQELRLSNAARDVIVLTRLTSQEFAGNIAVQPYQISIAKELRYFNPVYLGLSVETDALVDASESKTAAGRIISGFFGKLQKPFKSNKPETDDPDPKGFSIWDIAEYGIKGINALGDHEYTLVRQYNEKGKVNRVMLLEE